MYINTFNMHIQQPVLLPFSSAVWYFFSLSFDSMSQSCSQLHSSVDRSSLCCLNKQLIKARTSLRMIHSHPKDVSLDCIKCLCTSFRDNVFPECAHHWNASDACSYVHIVCSHLKFERSETRVSLRRPTLWKFEWQL